MPGRGTVPAVTDADSRPGRWRALGIVCAALVLSISSWFSATAITPELRDTWKLSGPFLVWLTNGVQIGFVIGALALSLVNLPDIIRLNRLMAAPLSLYGHALSRELWLHPSSLSVSTTACGNVVDKHRAVRREQRDACLARQLDRSFIGEIAKVVRESYPWSSAAPSHQLVQTHSPPALAMPP
jgi:hypothetical protein